MNDDRRSDDLKLDGAYGLAVLYTIGYLGLMFTLMFHEIPATSREPLLTLLGIMSAAQMGIIKFFYDGSRSADKVQQANIARSVKSEAVVQEIAKAAPVTAAAAVAAATGIVPVPVIEVPPTQEPAQ
jgi:hypothetical protein